MATPGQTPNLSRSVAGRVAIVTGASSGLGVAFATALAEAGASWDVIQLQASRSQPILDMHRMAAQNPVWIVTARKEIS